VGAGVFVVLDDRRAGDQARAVAVGSVADDKIATILCF